MTSTGGDLGEGTVSSGPRKRIQSMEDMAYWKSARCQAHRELVSFISQLNECCKRIHNRGLNRRELITSEHLTRVVALVDSLSGAADDVIPFDSDPNQRFGNKAFRDWFDKMSQLCRDYIDSIKVDDDVRSELLAYLLDSFGNRTRIDYGTGHELNFIVFLLGLYKCVLCNDSTASESDSGFRQPAAPPARSVLEAHCRELVTLFAVAYLPLCRKFQLRYTLEPAGSHGVYSLDDFQFLPFLFGSAQLIDHPSIKTNDFPDAKVAEEFKEEFIFHAAIAFIHRVKRGLFAEHSNKLWNISGVEDWERINSGLFKMYQDEVLHQFPIIQHLLFGKHILVWK